MSEPFSFHKEYASGELVDSFVAGIMYHYVPSAFLDGYINLVKHYKLFLLERYIAQGAYYESTVLSRFGTEVHTRLAALKDDSVVLAESSSHLWLFHYDMDCSDCSIGRVLRGQSSREQLSAWVTDVWLPRWRSETSQEFLQIRGRLRALQGEAAEEDALSMEALTGWRELPVSWLSGWVGF